MALKISISLYYDITSHLVKSYPNEGAGILIGQLNPTGKQARTIMPFQNKFAVDQQHHRYLITAEDMQDGERAAEENGLDVLGVYHSHPDHPAEPSRYDRVNAWPWYSYLIISVQNHVPGTARCWRLADDRSKFNEEELLIEE